MVGKTSLITRYIHDQFNLKPGARTVEAYFTEKIIKINENSFAFNIWVIKKIKFKNNLIVGYCRRRKISCIGSHLLQRLRWGCFGF